jgi:hypothetical protein
MKIITAATKPHTSKKRGKTAKDIDNERISSMRKQQNQMKQQFRPKSKKQQLKENARKKREVPKTVQKTLPYLRVCDNWIFQVDTDKFSKTYEFDDINYTAADEEEQKRIMSAYRTLMTGFDSTTDLQITIHNNHINKNDFERHILIREKGDKYDEYRREYNEMLSENLLQGQNGIMCKKYLTVTANAIDLEMARQRFGVTEAHIRTCFNKIGANIRALNANERMRIFADVFRGANVDITEISEGEFLRGAERSLVCPSYIEFKSDYFLFEKKYARMMFVRQLPPSSLNDIILTEVTRTNLNLMISVNVSIVDPEEATTKVNRQITSLKQEQVEREKSATKSGIFVDVLPEPLKRSLEQATSFLHDLQTKNEKMTLVNITIMILADSYEELEANTEKVSGVFRKYVCSIGTAMFMQEDCLASCLPVGNCRLEVRRTLQTESTVVFMPFNAREMSHDGGFYYGLNQTTNNLIMFNRKNLLNANGFILGAPGGGKSFAAKREMVNCFLATDDDILIVDPEREYAALAKALGGEVIFISENSKSYFNPLEIMLVSSEERKRAKVEDTDDPIKSKLDFLLSFFQTIMGSIKPEQKTIIDQCLHTVYQPYLLDPKPENMPTLVEYLDVLKKHPDTVESKSLISSLELYVTGSLNTFSHRTNVNVNNRIVVYDIKDLGKQLKPLGMSIVLENLWAKIVQNRLRGRNTRIYIDEMYLLFGNEESANFFYELYKRARKWGGIPTGITQNVEDLLKSDTGRAMLANTMFILMLNQNTTDRETLAELLKIPESSMEFVNGCPPGSGLMYTFGYGVIPFKDYFPKNTKLYQLMTTKFDETQT